MTINETFHISLTSRGGKCRTALVLQRRMNRNSSRLEIRNLLKPINTRFKVLRFSQGTPKCLSYNRNEIFIYKLTNDRTIISNTIITNNMLLHVWTFKISSTGSSLCLAKITYRFSGLSKVKLLKYKMMIFNKMLIVQRNKMCA